MMKIVLAPRYHGICDIEYEDDKRSAPEGIRATKTLVEKVREEMS